MAVSSLSAARTTTRAAPQPQPPNPSTSSSSSSTRRPNPTQSPPARRPHRRQSAPDLLHSPTPPPPPADPDADALVPIVFSWKYQGQLVYVAGAWDKWRRKYPLYRYGPNCIALIYIPIGEYQCKFFVDDNWQCATHLPTKTDEHGNTNNLIKVTHKHLEYDSPAPLDSRKPLSPLSSYRQNTCADFPSEPPVLPSHLLSRNLRIPPSVTETPPDESDSMPKNSAPHDGAPALAHARSKPFFSHVYINHLYHAPVDPDEQEVQSLSQSTRIGDKIIDTVFVTRRMPPAESEPETNGFVHKP